MPRGEGPGALFPFRGVTMDMRGGLPESRETLHGNISLLRLCKKSL